MKVRLSLKLSLNLFRSHVDNVYFGERLRTFSGNEGTINEQSGFTPNRLRRALNSVNRSGHTCICFGAVGNRIYLVPPLENDIYFGEILNPSRRMDSRALTLLKIIANPIVQEGNVKYNS